MSTPGSRRRAGRRHVRRLGSSRSRSRRSSSTPTVTNDVLEIEDQPDHDQTCIDLTSDPMDVIDLTSVNDSPVVVLSSIDGGHRSRPTRGRSRWRGRTSPRSLPPRSQRIFTESSDDSDDDLPAIDLPGTPYRPPPSSDTLPANVSTSPQINIVCPICMDDFKQIRRSGRHVRSTVCGHMFCNDCIKQAINAQHSCPTCRKRLKQSQTLQLYF